MIFFFTDPLLRGPTIGSMLMACAIAMVGVLTFVQKRSLLGETLSHATYPGVAVAIALSSSLAIENWLPSLVLFFAFLSALVGLVLMHFLQTRLKVREDSALTLILAAFFGVGITIASLLQFTHPKAYRLAGTYLYGQVATMGDRHIFLHGLFFCVVLGVIVLFYKELQALSFDRQFIRNNTWVSRFLTALVFLLVVCVIVLGIRTVGVVLISALLIAPAAAARQYTDRLSVMFMLAALIGAISGFVGNYLSYTFSSHLLAHHLPVGPMIVLTASFLALFSLFFAPKRGLAIRFGRIFLFRCTCLQENILKRVWRTPE
ncbi:MAG: Manganese transport system membrane protein MntB, partial [Chlamydiae bacterium]|nr:Manganese transport system membrane protein MntB [Chlamydiota bacterium]